MTAPTAMPAFAPVDSPPLFVPVVDWVGALVEEWLVEVPGAVLVEDRVCELELETSA